MLQEYTYLGLTNSNKNENSVYVSNDCFEGSFEAFHAWRNKLAEVANLAVVEFTEGDLSLPLANLAYADCTEAQWIGYWNADQAVDPLYYLLVHSDHEGVLLSNEQYKLIPRLAELIELLPNEDGGPHIGNWKIKTQIFLNGLRDAYVNAKQIVFTHNVPPTIEEVVPSED